MSISVVAARELVARSVRRIVPDADVAAASDDADLRRTFDLDSLDFLGFVESLVAESGLRIDEDDYPELASIASCVAFLVRRGDESRTR